MKKKPTPNKAEKFAEDEYFRQAIPKDKERRKFASEIYEHPSPLPKKKKKKLKSQ